jgi:hypothetical protein
MKKSSRLALLACAGLVGLAFAAPALAVYQPYLRIEQSSYKLGARTTADILVVGRQNDDPSAKLTVLAPSAYGVNLSQAPGTKIGRAIALVEATQLANSLIPLSGDIVVGNPADASIAAASAKCTGSAVSQAVFILNLKVAGQTQTVPFLVFANKIGPQATFQVCVPHPADAPFGAKVLALDATFRGVFTNPSASSGYEWSSLFTPYTPAKVPNPAGTIEWRTWVGLPSSLTFKRVKSRTGLKFAGALHVTGISSKRVRLRLYYGKKANPAPNAVSGGDLKAKQARTARLPASGKYTIKRPAVKVRTFFQMRFEDYETDCAPPSPAPQGCKGEAIAPMTSAQVRVSPTKRRR